MGRKVGGGVDPMHLSNTAHPFQKSGKTPKPGLASSQAAHPTARGSVGPGQSANAQMKTRRALNGSGKA